MLVVGVGIRWVLGAGLKDSGTACLVGGGGGGCRRVLTEARYWATLAQTNSWRGSPRKSLLLHRGITIDRAAGLLGGAESACLGLVDW